MNRTSLVLTAATVGLLAGLASGVAHSASAAPTPVPAATRTVTKTATPAPVRKKVTPAPAPAAPVAPTPAPEPVLEPPTHSADEAMRWLLGGNAWFTRNGRPVADIGAERRAEIAEAQAPLCTVLTCADSRVPPEHIFNAGLGELFTVRVAGNVAEPATLASIEYATQHLHTGLVVVMGHERCGAVKAAMGTEDLGPNLNLLLNQIRPSIAGVTDPDLAVRKNTEAQAAALGRSPILHQLVERGYLRIVPAIYDLDTGVVDFIEGATAQR